MRISVWFKDKVRKLLKFQTSTPVDFYFTQNNCSVGAIKLDMNISSLQRRITIVWDLPLLSNISTISHTHRIANTIYIGADCDFEIIDEFSATICPAV